MYYNPSLLPSFFAFFLLFIFIRRRGVACGMSLPHSHSINREFSCEMHQTAPCKPGTPRVLSGSFSSLINRCIRRPSLCVKWTRLRARGGRGIFRKGKFGIYSTVVAHKILPALPPSRCPNVGSVGGSIGSQFEFLRASHRELGVPPERVDRLVKLHARTPKMSIRGHMDLLPAWPPRGGKNSSSRFRTRVVIWRLLPELSATTYFGRTDPQSVRARTRSGGRSIIH